MDRRDPAERSEGNERGESGPLPSKKYEVDANWLSALNGIVVPLTLVRFPAESNPNVEFTVVVFEIL